ncbi:MAG: DUF2905 domain-containing protein [Pseudomonadota bacterium]
MIRWVAVVFVVLTIFPVLFPALKKLGIGRCPGDLHIKIGRYDICLPFGSVLLVSLILFCIAELA